MNWNLRTILIHCCLCAAAFGGALAFFMNRNGSTGHEEGTGPRLNAAPWSPVAAVGVLPPGSPDAVTNPAEQLDYVALAAQSEAEVAAQASRDAMSSADVSIRASAINSLGDTATPEALLALELAATRDDNARNRVRAIVALSRLAAQLEDRSPVIAILERAAADENMAVSSRAASVLRELAAPGDETASAAEFEPSA